MCVFNQATSNDIIVCAGCVCSACKQVKLLIPVQEIGLKTGFKSHFSILRTFREEAQTRSGRNIRTNLLLRSSGSEHLNPTDTCGRWEQRVARQPPTASLKHQKDGAALEMTRLTHCDLTLFPTTKPPCGPRHKHQNLEELAGSHASVCCSPLSLSVCGQEDLLGG